MWVWEVDDEVEPIVLLISSLWELLLRLLIMPCYASRRGSGECIHDRCEIVKLMVYLRWQLKYTSGWIEAPGVSSDCLFFWKSRGYRVIFLWTATQAQRELRLSC